jgi:hypothetical protein
VRDAEEIAAANFRREADFDRAVRLIRVGQAEALEWALRQFNHVSPYGRIEGKAQEIRKAQNGKEHP